MTEAFAMLASNEDSSGGHDAPLPFTYQETGEMMEFKTTDGQSSKAFAIRSNIRSDKYLLVIHDWWDPNDYIKQEAARFAKDIPGVNVIALDLYDGQVATDANHAFANPSNPKYSKPFAEDAHAAAVAYLKKNLKLK